MGRWKSGCDIRTCACPAWGGYSQPRCTRLYAIAAAGSGIDPAKSLVPVVVAVTAATAEPAAGHSVIYVTALHEAASEARGCLYIGIGVRAL